MKNLKISKRAEKAIASSIRKFEPLITRAESRGLKVFKLQVGDPDLEAPPQIWREIKKYNQKTWNYAPTSGFKEYLDAWIKYYANLGIKIKRENIIPTVGASEAMLISMLLVANPRDEILVFEPLYTPYKGFASFINVKLVPIALELKNNFQLPPEKEIVKRISPRTKAILVINPDNPTGKIWTKKEMEIIVKIAGKYNLFILADETYREIVFEGKHWSFLKFRKAWSRIVILDSLSKRFSVPGAREGVIISRNQEIIESAFKFATLRLSAPALEQRILTKMLRDIKASRIYFKKITDEYRRRKDIVVEALEKIPGITYYPPQGAFYLIAELPIKNSEDFVRFLLTKFNRRGKTVMVTPMQDFYISRAGRNQIRIACVLDSPKLKQAVNILSLGLKAYLSRRLFKD